MLAKRIALWRPRDHAAIESVDDNIDTIDLKGLYRYFHRISKHDSDDDYTLIADHILQKYIDRKRERELFEPLFTKRQNLIKVRRTHGGVLRKNVTARLEENERREKKGKEPHHFIDDVMLLKRFMSKVSSTDEYLKSNVRQSKKNNDSSDKQTASQTHQSNDDVLKPDEGTENLFNSTEKDDDSDEIVYLTSRNMKKIQYNLVDHSNDKKKEAVNKIGNIRSKAENSKQLVKAKLNIASYKEEFSKSKDRAMRTKVLNEIKKLLSFYYMKPDRRNQLDSKKVSDKLYEDGEIVHFLKTRVEGVKDFVSHGFPGMKNGTKNITIDEGTLLNTFYPKAMKAMFSYSNSLQGNEPESSAGPHNLTQDLIFLDQSLKGGDDNGTVTNVHSFVRNLEYLIKSGYLSKNSDDEILTNVQTFMKYLVTFLDQNMNDTSAEVTAKDNDISSGLVDGNDDKKSSETSYEHNHKQHTSSSSKPDKNIDLNQLAQQTDEIDYLENKMAKEHAFDEKNNGKSNDDKHKEQARQDQARQEDTRLAKLGFDELNSDNNGNDNNSDNPSPGLKKHASQLKNGLNSTDFETNDLVQKTERRLSPAAEKLDEELTAIYNLKNKEMQGSNNLIHNKNQTDSFDNKWRLTPNNGIQYEYHTPIHDDDSYVKNEGNELPFFKKESKTNSFDNVVNAHKKKTFSDTKISKALHPNENYVVLRCLGFKKHRKHTNSTNIIQKRTLHILEEHLVNYLMRRSPNEARVHTAMGDIWLPCHRLGNVRKLSNVSEFASKSISKNSAHLDEQNNNVSHEAYHHQNTDHKKRHSNAKHHFNNFTAQVVDVILPARRLSPSNQTTLDGPDDKLDSFFNKSISPIENSQSSKHLSTPEDVKVSKNSSRQNMKNVTEMLAKDESPEDSTVSADSPTDTSMNVNDDKMDDTITSSSKHLQDGGAEKLTSNTNDDNSENTKDSGSESVPEGLPEKLTDDLSENFSSPYKKENLTEDLEKYVPAKDIINVTDALDNYFLSNNNQVEEETCENGYIRTGDKRIQCRSDISNQYEALTSETETNIMNDIINHENNDSKSKTSEIDSYVPSSGSKHHDQSKTSETSAEEEKSQNFVDMKNMTYGPDQTSFDKALEQDTTNAGMADKPPGKTPDKEIAATKEDDSHKSAKNMTVSTDDNENTEIKEKTENIEKSEKSQKAEKAEKAEKTESGGNTVNTEKTQTAENSEKVEKSEKDEKTEKEGNTVNTEKIKSDENSEKVNKAEKSKKSEKAEKTNGEGNTVSTEKTKTAENGEKVEKSEKTEKTEKSDEKPKTGNNIDLVNKTDPFHLNTTQDNLRLFLVGVPINGTSNSSSIIANLTNNFAKDKSSDTSREGLHQQLIQSSLDKSLVIEPLQVNVIPNGKGLMKLNSSLESKTETDDISRNSTTNNGVNLSTMKNISVPGKNHSSNMSIDIKVDKDLDYEPLAKLIVQQISNLFSSKNYTMSIEPNDNKTMNVISAHVIRNNSNYYVAFAGNNTGNKSLLLNTTSKTLQIPLPGKQKDKQDDKKKDIMDDLTNKTTQQPSLPGKQKDKHDDKNKDVVDDLTAVRHHNAFVTLYNHNKQRHHHKRHHPHHRHHHKDGHDDGQEDGHFKDKPRFVTVNDEENISNDNPPTEEFTDDNEASRNEPEENEENDDNESDEEDEEPMTDPSLFKAMNYNPNTEDENNIHQHENYHGNQANNTHAEDDYDDNEDDEEDEDSEKVNRNNEIHSDRAEVDENELLHGEDGKGVIHDDSFDGMDSDQYNRNNDENAAHTQVNEFVENQSDILQAASRLVDGPPVPSNEVNQYSAAPQPARRLVNGPPSQNNEVNQYSAGTHIPGHNVRPNSYPPEPQVINDKVELNQYPTGPQIAENTVEPYHTGPQIHAANFDVDSFSTVHQTAGPQVAAPSNVEPNAFSEAPSPISSKRINENHDQFSNQLDLKKIMENVDRSEEPLINSEINAKVSKQSENQYWTPLYSSQPGTLKHPTNITSSSAVQIQQDPTPQTLEPPQSNVVVKTSNIQISQMNSDAIIDNALQTIDHPQGQTTSALITKALQSADSAMPLPHGSEENIDDSLKHLPVRKALMEHNQVHLYTGPSVNYYTNDLAASDKDSTGFQKSLTPEVRLSKSKYETQIFNLPDTESNSDSQNQMTEEYKKLVAGINTDASTSSSPIYAGSGLVNIDKTLGGGGNSKLKPIEIMEN